MKPSTAVFRSTRLLDQVRERIRYLHYSLQTEKAYLYWVRFFIRWQGRNGAMRHPRVMSAAEVKAFLTMLANERRVSESTHKQVLSALLFLYREVLGVDLPWLNGLNRPAQKRRIAAAGSPYAASAQQPSFLITSSHPRQARATVRGTGLEPLL